ncbi:MAG: NTP transferase domain-containing protein [Hyphomicrobiales bacterium]|nr:NTP transferase domain-containing protein [Hyphomicrobiales bacterium]
MKFGPVPVSEAENGILAHSVRLGDGVLRKGTVLSIGDISRLTEAGIDKVTVARLEAGDVAEDRAAERLASTLAGDGLGHANPFTGRSNIHAEAAGLLIIDGAAINICNRIDPAITVATVPAFSVVAPGQMAATVKVIPFSVAETELHAAIEAGQGALQVAPFRPFKVGLVATVLPTLKSSVMDKTRRLLAERLSRAGARILTEKRVTHQAGAVATGIRSTIDAGADLVVVFGASATSDLLDVVPAGLVDAGGKIIRFGMPVDPGNLLVFGSLGEIPVVGAPGCARSPKENGFDWILNRLLAGVEVTPDDITGLGVGGLLTEIVSRPQPRAARDARATTVRTPRVGAIVLAAGQARRMGGPNKLTATVDGSPLVRIATQAAIGSVAKSVVVVTGHRADETVRAVDDLDVRFAHNPDYANGLSSSLKCGIAALPPGLDAAVVLLADMPRIDAATIDRLIKSFDPAGGGLIVVPTCQGKRGNPVLWSRRLFPELLAVEGDVGGRHLIGLHADAVVEVEIGPAASIDVDTPADLAAAGGRAI